MIVVPFRAEHMLALSDREDRPFVGVDLTVQQVVELENLKLGYTGLVDGKVMACAGLHVYWPGRAEAWAYVSKEAGPHMVAITRAVKAFLKLHDDKRIEAVVDLEFADGLRWIQLLGFELEAPKMRRYAPGGRDCALYALVK